MSKNLLKICGVLLIVAILLFSTVTIADFGDFETYDSDYSHSNSSYSSSSYDNYSSSSSYDSDSLGFFTIPILVLFPIFFLEHLFADKQPRIPIFRAIRMSISIILSPIYLCYLEFEHKIRLFFELLIYVAALFIYIKFAKYEITITFAFIYFLSLAIQLYILLGFFIIIILVFMGEKIAEKIRNKKNNKKH